MTSLRNPPDRSWIGRSSIWSSPSDGPHSAKSPSLIWRPYASRASGSTRAMYARSGGAATTREAESVRDMMRLYARIRSRFRQAFELLEYPLSAHTVPTPADRYDAPPLARAGQSAGRWADVGRRPVERPVQRMAQTDGESAETAGPPDSPMARMVSTS